MVAVEDVDGKLRVTFTCGAPVDATRVILATGSELDAASVPLLANAARDFGLPVVDGLPALDDDLAWGDERFFVVGALATLQVGPDAGNLTGARRAADVCAANLAGQQKGAKFPTSKAHISAVFHSFRLIFGRAIISRNGLEAWMCFS